MLVVLYFAGVFGVPTRDIRNSVMFLSPSLVFLCPFMVPVLQYSRIKTYVYEVTYHSFRYWNNEMFLLLVAMLI